MTPEQKAAFIVAQSACAMAKIGGMAAVNQGLLAAGEKPAYTADDFDAVFREFIIDRDAVLAFFGTAVPT